MKKYITAPIGSAIIVPGFGQVLNGQIKKGIVLMGVVFVLFAAGVGKLVQIAMGLLPELDPDKINFEEILVELDVMDISTMRVIMIVFLIVWIYSIIDALINGIKIERKRK